MLARLSAPLLAFAASVLLLAGLVAALYWTGDTGHALPGNDPLVVYCAEAMRLPLDAIAKDYEKEFHQKVDLHFGSSQYILVNLELSQKGDLFLPADDSFIRLAKKKNLLDDVFNIAKMHAVVIVRPNFPTPIKTWDDFLAPGNKIGLGNTDATAIGKILKQHLQGAGLWDAVEKHDVKYMTNVNEVCNSVRLGSVDVGIVWDVIALPRPELTIVKLKELNDVQARVQIALAKSSQQPTNARRFVNYLRAKDKGAPHLKRQGYSDIDEGDAMANRPELVVYAGAMLRPALEASLNEFEKRENVRITRVYNGCGILVSQMKTGEMPDIYFACDTTFMAQVRDEFEKPTNVSSNQLMIVTKKGNAKAKDLKQLLDLGKPGLRVGVGHEQQCALGALTKETFIRTGVYAQVIKNVVVQSPTGDFLINQLRTGSLDVVVAYRSNVEPFKDELDGIPITGIPCAAPQQPIAVSKSTTHPDLSKRLMEFLQTEESRARFEKLGFGWELKTLEK
jgi:molybdate transport system substrate-binding protein